MRILTISNTPHNPSQGSGYAICGYVEGLRACGHQVDAYGPEHFVTFDTNRAKRYLHPLMMARFGLRHVAETNYDLVECYGAESWILMCLLAGRNRNFALVHHSNGIEPHAAALGSEATRQALLQGQRWFQANLTPLHEIGFRSVDAIVTVSEFDAQYARAKKYIPPGHIHAINNALPNFLLDRYVSFERPNRIGYCGNWIPRKGAQVIVQDVPKFLRSHPDWIFSLVGVGKEFDARAHFPPDVHGRIEVIPFLPREELSAWYEQVAVFICPSNYESFGLVQTEAMACGATLVSTNVGFAASLEHGTSAIHLPAPASPHLLNALCELADDEGLRRGVARNGYDAVQGLRWTSAIERLESIYKNLIRQRAALSRGMRDNC